MNEQLTDPKFAGEFAETFGEDTALLFQKIAAYNRKMERLYGQEDETAGIPISIQPPKTNTVSQESETDTHTEEEIYGRELTAEERSYLETRRLVAQYDRNTQMDEAYEAGFRQGFHERYAEGFAIGYAEAQNALAAAMRKSGMSEEEIQAIFSETGMQEDE